MLNNEVSFMPPGDSFRVSVAVTNIANAVIYQSLRVSTTGTDCILEKLREVKATLRVNF